MSVKSSQPLVNKIILYFVVRAMVDIIGENATKVVLREAGMLDLLELDEPPDPDEVIPLENMTRLRRINMKIFGDAHIVFSRRAGTIAARKMKLPRGVESIIKLSSKIADWRKIMADVSNRLLAPVDSRMEQELINGGYTARIYNCPECRGVKSNKPCCYFLSGFTEGIIRRLFNLNVTVVETRCIATGDEFCEFKVTPEE